MSECEITHLQHLLCGKKGSKVLFKTAAKTLSSFFLPEVRVSDQQKAAAADPLWTMWEQQAIWTSP